MKSKLTHLLLVFFVLLELQAQTVDPLKIPEIIPKSPEVESFSRYGNIPVSEFSGSPNISIPLHTVQYGEISIPIYLNYQASGIQVTQESTIVGLGWDLVAGGNICYIPIGGDERVLYNVNDYNPWISWEKWLTVFDLTKGLFYEPHDYYNPTIAYLNGYFRKSGEDIDFQTLGTNQVSADLSNWCIKESEGEQDIYSANFLGHSFRFFRHPLTKKYVFVGQKTKDSILWDDALKSFIIVGDDGTKYSFTAKEVIYDSQKTNCWYLTSIKDIKGNYAILKYSSFGSIYSIPPLNEKFVHATLPFGNGARRRDISNLNRRINNLYLTEIETNLESVKFIYLTDRKDLNGSGKRHLGEILVKNRLNNDTVKWFKFDYDYFEGSKIGGNYLDDDDVADRIIDPLPTEESIKFRLKLTGIKKVNPSDITKIAEKYAFTYNETSPLPWKTSFSRDFWGFYNGQENEGNFMSNSAMHTLIPDMNLYNGLDENEIPAAITELKGANRSTDKSKNILGMLKTIAYPTGGKTEFNFGTHISNSIYGGSAISKQNSYSQVSLYVLDYNESNYSKPAVVFTLTENTEVEFTPGFNMFGYSIDKLLDTYIELNKVDPPGRLVYKFRIIDDPVTWSKKKFILEPGVYVLHCNLDEQIKFTSVTDMKTIVTGNIAYLKKNELSEDDKIKYGVGIRIDSIRNFDQNGKIISRRKYTYFDGVELKPISHYKKNNYINVECYDSYPGSTTYYYRNETKYTISSDNLIRMATIEPGSTVGYSRIEIEDLSEKGTNGKEILHFSNYSPALVMSRVFYFPNSITSLSAAGDLIKKVYLNSNNDTIRIEKNTYNEIDENREFINAVFEDYYNGCKTSGGGIPRYGILTYINRNYFHYLKKKETYDYLVNGKFYNKTEYNYNLNNYCLNEVKELTSQNKLKRIIYKYPHDYNSGVYSAMIANNQISPVIEQTSYLDNKFLNMTKITYRNFQYGNLSPIYLRDSVYSKNDDENNRLDFRIKFEGYDYLGNLLQLHKSNDINTSYIWSYTNSIPVIKAENVDYSTLNSAVSYLQPEFNNFLVNVIGDLTTESQKTTWKNFNSAIRSNSNLKNAQITTYTYKPLIGMTSQTDTNGKTTYYEYDDFGRLKCIKDNDGSIVKAFDYQYKK